MSLDDAWEASGLVGKLFAGHYLIVRELVADARRSLYEAEHVERGERVTLGVVRAQGGEAEQRLRNAEKLRSLDQAGLVSVLDVGRLESGQLYVATQWPGGATLRDLMRGTRLAQARALLITRRVLEALAPLHAIGEIHGDVNPAHIFVATALGTDRVTLGGLGIATLAGAAPTGDPMYCAPEPTLGPRADLYAVGAVLYELLTGRPPFFADTPDALRRLHALAPVQKLKQRAPELSFTDTLETIVATALAKKPDRRFASANEMIELIDRSVGDVEDAAPAVAPGEQPEEVDNSLLLLAQDLLPQPAAADPAAGVPPVPFVPDNVGREIPALPLPTRARDSVRRVIDRLSTRLRLPRRMLVGGLAAAAAIGLVVALVMCTGSTRRTPGTSAEHDGPTSARSQTPEAAAAVLGKRCEQLGKTCGDGAKHVSRITEQCKQAAARQLERGCAEAVVTAYDCYERKLCGKADKVWALDDLGVLSARRSACVTETKAMRACVSP